MYTWTLGIQHAFGASTSLTVNYVGTHTSDLSSEIQCQSAGAGGQAGLQQRQPYYSQFPWFNGIFVYGPAGFPTTTPCKRASFCGISRTDAETLAIRSRGTWPLQRAAITLQTNSQCVACDYGLRTPTQDLGVTLVYTLPGIKSPVRCCRDGRSPAPSTCKAGEPFSGLDAMTTSLVSVRERAFRRRLANRGPCRKRDQFQ